MLKYALHHAEIRAEADAAPKTPRATFSMRMALCCTGNRGCFRPSLHVPLPSIEFRRKGAKHGAKGLVLYLGLVPRTIVHDTQCDFCVLAQSGVRRQPSHARRMNSIGRKIPSLNHVKAASFDFQPELEDAKVLLASHNRLLWYHYLTGKTTVLHQGQVTSLSPCRHPLTRHGTRSLSICCLHMDNPASFVASVMWYQR